MKKRLKKITGMLLTGALTMGLLAGCGSGSESEGNKSEGGNQDPVKIGVLVADVSGEEAQGFRAYYENYIAENYNVEFEYTDALEDASGEKAAIEKFASQGCDAVISFSSSDRAMQIETCEEYGVYYAIASGVLDEEQYETYKGYEYFVGQVGPSNEVEFETGKAMGEYYREQGVENVAVYGAFIPNPMHVYRVAGVIAGLGDTYGGSADMNEMVGQIFADQTVDLTKIAGDVNVVAYLQGYGDTTTDEINAAIQKSPDALLSVGMATTFFTQTLNEAGIPFGDIDSFTEANGEAIKNGELTYLAGKYSSSIGPVFALVMNAVEGNVIRDAEGNAASVSQNYFVATDGETFDEYYLQDNGDNPIYDKETLDTIIGEDVTYDDVAALVESK